MRDWPALDVLAPTSTEHTALRLAGPVHWRGEGGRQWHRMHKASLTLGTWSVFNIWWVFAECWTSGMQLTTQQITLQMLPTVLCCSTIGPPPPVFHVRLWSALPLFAFFCICFATVCLFIKFNLFGPPPPPNNTSGVVQNWSTLQCSKQNTEQCGYDHAPVTRGRMRAQFPLPHGPTTHHGDMPPPPPVFQLLQNALVLVLCRVCVRAHVCVCVCVGSVPLAMQTRSVLF